MINKSAGVRNVLARSTPIAHITELDNNVSAHQVL